MSDLARALLPPAAAAQSRRSAWIPWIFVVGLGVVVAANVAFTLFALSSAPGTVNEHPYEEGREYNDILARAQAQDRLGWTIEAALAGEARAGEVRRGELRIHARDRAGVPLGGAQVEGRLVRPVGPSSLLPIEAKEVAPGVYAAAVEIGPGQWDLALVVRRGPDRFAWTTRVFLK